MRLGLLSTARINDKLIKGAAEAPDVTITAIGSRDLARAEAYAAERGIETAHGSYEALLADPNVDAVYISLPNALHHEWTMKALQAGKHVLAEKPYTLHPAEVDEAFDTAERAGLVLTEAFMWRHHPQAHALEELVRSEEIGELRMVRAAFGFMLDDPDDVRLSASLEGGALTDVGCYCVSASRLLGGEPVSVTAQAVRVPDGVDTRLTGTLRFASGLLAQFGCWFDMPYRSEIEVFGSKGTAFVGDPFHSVDVGIDVVSLDGNKRRIEIEPLNPYGCELNVMAGVIAGTASPVIGRADALGQARTIDALYRAAASGAAVSL